MKEIEILAPAGSIDGLYGAMRAGADAVYVGTTRFGARAFADNPAVGELERALAYAHLRGKKIYLTVNTLLSDGELEELFHLVRPLYEAGLDACIVQDMGVLKFLHGCFPEMPLHASTQMTLFSGEEANLLKPYGVTRYVPARELSIGEIREAREQTDMEIEVFVHGALCYCYSGQCLMSEVIGGRSGNRGMCAQPCRLSYHTPYGDGRFLSTKDICTLMYIPELVDAGIDSFKIEGRMKKKEYAMYLSHLYRKYVDLYLREGASFFDGLREDGGSELWRDYRRSGELYNRGGFSDGFLFEDDKAGMVYPKRNGHFGVKVGSVKETAGNANVPFAYEKPHYAVSHHAVSRPAVRGSLHTEESRSDSSCKLFVAAGNGMTGSVKETVRRGSRRTGDVNGGDGSMAGKGKTDRVQFVATEALHYQDILEFRDEDGTSAYEYTVKEGAEAGAGVWTNVRRGSHVYPGQDVYRTRNAALLEMIRGRFSQEGDRYPLRGVFRANQGENAVLAVTGNRVSVAVCGDPVQAAAKRPVSEADIRSRLEQMGNTDYRWEDLDVWIEPDSFLPLGGLKELRRRAVAEWEKAVCGGRAAMDGNPDVLADLSLAAPSMYVRTNEMRMVSVADRAQLEAALEGAGEDTIFHLKLEDLPSVHWREAAALLRGRRMALSFPRVLRGEGKMAFEREWAESGDAFPEAGTEIVVVNSYAAYLYAKRYFPRASLHADTNLYQENRLAGEAYMEMGIRPPFAKVYGRVAVMVTEACLARTLSKCEGNCRFGKTSSGSFSPRGAGLSSQMNDAVPSRIPITTPKGDKFIVVNHCKYCYNTIYTDKPWNRPSSGQPLPPWRRLDFTWEQGEEIRKGIRQWNF